MFCGAVLPGQTRRAGRGAQVWDLGGQANLRPSWAAYYKATDAVIVVIDSTDRARVSIAKARMLVPSPQQSNRAAAAKVLQLQGAMLLVAKPPETLKETLTHPWLRRASCLGCWSTSTWPTPSCSCSRTSRT